MRLTWLALELRMVLDCNYCRLPRPTASASACVAVARRDDQTSLKVSADEQLLYQEPGEQETQRLAREHLAINGRDLMRKRLNL